MNPALRLCLVDFRSPCRGVAQGAAVNDSGEMGYGLAGKPLHYKGTPFHRIIPGFVSDANHPLLFATCIGCGSASPLIRSIWLLRCARGETSLTTTARVESPCTTSVELSPTKL